jgi:hypothetical protein
VARFDLDVYNEANGFVITSGDVCGTDFSEVEASDPRWTGAMAQGVLLPFELVQDDAFIVRVVVEEPLNAEEETEWVGRTRHRLQLPEGRLVVVGGGSDFLYGEDVDEVKRTLKVPPGTYDAHLYTYLPGRNGFFCLESAGASEAIGRYFRRTRATADHWPEWLAYACHDDPDADPGHQSDWENALPDADDEPPPYVDFILHLTRPRGGVDEPPPLPPLQDGWIAAGTGARQPATCPLGLPAVHLVLYDRG